MRPRRHYLSIATYVSFPSPGFESWLEFHRRAGVEHFFVAHPHGNAEDGAQLGDLSHRGDVTLYCGESGESAHASLLRAAKASRRLTRWLALIGPRDYLFSPTNVDLRAVLCDYESYSGVAVFPYEFIVEKDADSAGEALVLQSTRRIGKPSSSICAIVNPVLLRKIRRDGTVRVKAGRTLVDERGSVAIRQSGRKASAEILRIHRYRGERNPGDALLFERRGRERGRGAMRGFGKPIEDRTLADRWRNFNSPDQGAIARNGTSARGGLAQWARAAAYAVREARLRMPRRRYLCMSLMFKDAALYLVEWIEFHRLVGFEHFYLYDQASTDDSRSILQPYVAAGLVTLRSWPADKSQREYLEDCIESCRAETRWLALLDDDEFLFPARGGSMAEALEDYEEFGSVVVPWLMFGSSGHRTRPDGLVTENFTWRAAGVHPLHKCIVDPSRVEGFLTVHQARLRQGYVPANENKGAEPGARSRDLSIERFRLHHYYTKSYEEAEMKVRKRGYVPCSRINAEQHRAYLNAARGDDYSVVEDRTIQQYLPALKEAVAHPARPRGRLRVTPAG